MNRVKDIAFAKILFRDAVEEYPKYNWCNGYEINPCFDLLKITEDCCVAVEREKEPKNSACGKIAIGELCRVCLTTGKGQVYQFRPFVGEDKEWHIAPFCIGNEDFFSRLKEAWLEVEKHRQYSSGNFSKRAIYGDKYNLMPTMKKVWNRGMGLLEIWRIDHDKREILINTLLFNNCDRRHLRWLINEVPELKEYSVYGTEYGYPIFYNHSFGTKLGGRTKMII